MRLLLICSLCALTLNGCKTQTLSGGGARVATSTSAPVDSGWEPTSCKSLGYVVGRGGGAFGGAYISNEKLIEYAMNDLRNQAAKKNANFVQHDTPTMGQADGSTTTATVSGTAYICEQRRAGGAPAATATAPVNTSAPVMLNAAPSVTPVASPAAIAPGSANTAPPPTAPTSTCVPGESKACVGPGGCSGGQFCSDDGKRYSPCDCGSGNSAGDKKSKK